MWSTPTEVYPIIPVFAPVGQTLVSEPQVVRQDVTERMSVQRITGIDAYRQRPISQNVWVA